MSPFQALKNECTHSAGNILRNSHKCQRRSIVVIYEFIDIQNGQPLKETSECPPPSLISVTLDGRNPVSAELIVLAEGENWDNLEDDTKKTYRAATGKTNKDMNAKGISIKRI